MKEEIHSIVNKALSSLSDFHCVEIGDFDIQVPKKKEFGDFSTNVALILASKLNLKPREVAEKLLLEIKSFNYEIIDKLEIAGPGFINFFVKESSIVTKLPEIYKKNSEYGSSNLGKDQKVIIEFVSANPTGYLHFGHARNAVVGDSIARILSFSGYRVEKEFYINDAGRQMEMLGESVYLRYLETLGQTIQLPEDGYQGEYIIEIAKKIHKFKGESLTEKNETEALEFCTDFAYKFLLDEIKADLENLRVKFDNWYSEKLYIHTNSTGQSKIDKIRKKLQDSEALEDKEGALWFKATDYGDNQDWVLIKGDGSPTYLIADIAYHDDKYQRGFTKLINIWGADHHSHFSRLKASMKAIGNNDSILNVLLIQFVRLIKDGKEVSMSKRSGTFVTLRDVLNEVGCDVTRFFLLMRSSDSHLDFDLSLAYEQSSDNPVYYIQYAYARISSILRNAKDASLDLSDKYLDELNNEAEQNIIKKLIEFPEVVESSSNLLAPHKIVYYLQELASQFHVYYNKNKIINLEDRNLSSARIYFICCIQVVIRNGLTLLGVNSPERM